MGWNARVGRTLSNCSVALTLFSLEGWCLTERRVLLESHIRLHLHSRANFQLSRGNRSFHLAESILPLINVASDQRPADTQTFLVVAKLTFVARLLRMNPRQKTMTASAISLDTNLDSMDGHVPEKTDASATTLTSISTAPRSSAGHYSRPLSYHTVHTLRTCSSTPGVRHDVYLPAELAVPSLQHHGRRLHSLPLTGCRRRCVRGAGRGSDGSRKKRHGEEEREGERER